ncbi:hypothetical protein JCGZ_08044 [Jatropha curcas]|uniref:Uncharacterized protein n=1 Tax=Jatropha curcas TaxID=180498 RepID=A0A067KP57_JATCU|nr:uncharacterized protein LOC105635186 [Jatropha curcas]KDP36753.1 hypothetical protein JCGZ_08044 [Jatropha curcas]
MESGSEQMERRKAEIEEKKAMTEGLPLQSSPYLRCQDLEDYKRQGYGTEGHRQVKPNHGGGATDAPTLSGTGLPEGTPPLP